MKRAILILWACLLMTSLVWATDPPPPAPVDVPPPPSDLPDLPADTTSSASSTSKSANNGTAAPAQSPIDVSSTPAPDSLELPDLPDIPSNLPPSEGSQKTPSATQIPVSASKTGEETPGAKSPSQPKAPSTPSTPESYPPPQPTKVEPQPSQDIGGRPVPDPAYELMQRFKWEALFSSRPWIEDWWMPYLGIMRVTTLHYPLNAPRGGVIQWQRDSLGNPMVYLRARVPFPRLRAPDPLSAEQPFDTVQIVISQAVVFYARPDGWLACASPLYVTMEEAGKTFLLVPVERGQGIWRAMVGQGGIHVENFIGAGLQAARTEINQYFRDEEIRLFMQNNGDVVFYLRPNFVP